MALAAACRTTSSSLKDDAGDGSLHCKFLSPTGSGEAYDVWATPGDGGALNNCRDQYTNGALDGPQEGPVQTLGTVQPVGADELTSNGERGLRTWFKDVVDVDLRKFSCYAFSTGAASGAPNYFCLAKAVRNGVRDGVWATQASSQKYAIDLTVYRASCGGG